MAESSERALTPDEASPAAVPPDRGLVRDAAVPQPRRGCARTLFEEP